MNPPPEVPSGLAASPIAGMSCDEWLATINPEQRRLPDRRAIYLGDLKGWKSTPEHRVAGRSLLDGPTLTVYRTLEPDGGHDIPTLIGRVRGAVVGLISEQAGVLAIDIAVDAPGDTGVQMVEVLLEICPFVRTGGLSSSDEALFRSAHRRMHQAVQAESAPMRLARSARSGALR